MKVCVSPLFQSISNCEALFVPSPKVMVCDWSERSPVEPAWNLYNLLPLFRVRVSLAPIDLVSSGITTCRDWFSPP